MESGKWKGVFAGSGLPSTYIHTYVRTLEVQSVPTLKKSKSKSKSVSGGVRVRVHVCTNERTNLEVPRYVWKNRIEDGATEMEIGKCDLSSRDLGVVLLRGKKK